MVGVRSCYVPGCRNKTSPWFYIPTNKIIRNIWIQRINSDTIRRINQDNEIKLRNYPVCQKHFADICFEPTGRLKRNALPTLMLPGFKEAPTVDDSLHPHTRSSVFGTPEKVRSWKNIPVVERTAGPSTQKGVQQPLKSYQRSKKQGIKESTATSTDATVSSATSRESYDLDEGLARSLDLSLLPASPPPPEVPTKRGKKRAASPTDVSGKQYKRKQLLQIAGVTRQSHLTPKAKAFYKLARTLQKTAAKLKYSLASARKKVKFLTSNEKLLECMRKSVNPTTANFIACQQRTQKLKARGRRFNLNDKIFALSLYKQSGRAYRFLSNIFSLPSRKTVTAVLNQVPFRPGINQSIFEHLQATVRRMKRLDRHCVLMFDEISLEPGLQYNQRSDVLEGFVDYGGSAREAAFADHALVFIAKGTRRKWKQPVCFTFCEGTTPTAQLVKLVKDVVRALRSAGLHVVATISDQGATNQAAVNELLRETNAHFLRNGEENRLQGYLLDGEEIIHLYDFPHLMKGIRNNLLTKDLVYTEGGAAKVASWSHMLRLYEIDKSKGPLSQFFRLTDEHVLPDKIKKMKVKNCTQVFSHTVGTVMDTAARTSEDLPTHSKFYLDPRAVETAHIFLFFDKLFDSVNGAALHPPVGKPLRCVASNKTGHVEFWKTCIPVLDSMAFVLPTDHSKKMYTPSLKNWAFSLRGMISIVERMTEKGFKHVTPKCFNQDPIENFFSMVRSHGVRNTNPTCASFISSVKSLLVNNFVAPHSAGANCEKDESVGVLDTLKEFITEQANVDIGLEPPSVPLPVLPPSKPVNICFLFDYASAYVAGYVAKKVLATVDCPACSAKMCTDKDIPQNILIARREYETCRLIRPSSIFTYVFRKVTEAILNFVPKIVTIYIIKQKLADHVRDLFFEDISSLFCGNHANKVEIFVTITVNIIFFDYAKNINKILHGKDLRKAGQDAVTSIALKKHNKRYKTRKPF